MKVTFCYLAAYCQTGGIENFNRYFIDALPYVDKFCGSKADRINLLSFYDKTINTSLKPRFRFFGLNRNRLYFIIKFFLTQFQSDLMIFGHVNLIPLLFLYKVFNPRKKTFLIVHGIDVWYDLSNTQKKALKKIDKIISVSKYTADILQSKFTNYDLPITVFPNTYNSSLEIRPSESSVKKYKAENGLEDYEYIILTLARLKITEKGKGYDQVIRALPKIIISEPNVIYVLAGKYDEEEKNRIIHLAKEFNVENYIKFTGFVSDIDLANLYASANVFIMPSKKEGFGIVYIEALLFGVPVIAGKSGGSIEALNYGKWGTLVNPDSIDDIAHSILFEINNYLPEKQLEIRQAVIDKFGFPSFIRRLKAVFSEL